MSIISRNVTSDISSLGKLYSLLTLALQLNTTHIYQTHIDGSTPMIGGISYVVATPQQVATAVHQFLHPEQAPSTSPAAPTSAAASTTPQLPAAKVSVTVLNGSGQTGVAAVATSQSASSRLPRTCRRQRLELHLHRDDHRRRCRISSRRPPARGPAGSGASPGEQRLRGWRHHRHPRLFLWRSSCPILDEQPDSGRRRPCWRHALRSGAVASPGSSDVTAPLCAQQMVGKSGL